MLKKRLIPILLVKDNRCVKGKNFTDFRDTGNPITNARIYDAQGADELIILNISPKSRNLFLDMVQEISDQCFMPLTFGGGIKSVEDVETLMKRGADKISLNTAAVEKPSLITEISEKFGAQAVVVSIDARNINGKYEVFTQNGTKATGLNAVEWAKDVEKLGAGEILITSIDNEGLMKGYDLKLTREVARKTTIPIIASGGAGSLTDLVDVISKGEASAAATSSLLHFTDQSIIKARKFMKEAGLDVRYKA